MTTGTIDPTLDGTKERMEEEGYFEEGEDEMVICSCDGSCPDAVDVTLENNSYIINSGIVQFTIGTQPNPTVTIQMVDSSGNALEDWYSLGLALISDDTDPNSLLSSAPVIPGWITTAIITDTLGACTLSFNNSGTLTTVFYLVVTFAGTVTVSDAITVT